MRRPYLRLFVVWISADYCGLKSTVASCALTGNDDRTIWPLKNELMVRFSLFAYVRCFTRRGNKVSIAVDNIPFSNWLKIGLPLRSQDGHHWAFHSLTDMITAWFCFHCVRTLGCSSRTMYRVRTVTFTRLALPVDTFSHLARFCFSVSPCSVLPA